MDSLVRKKMIIIGSLFVLVIIASSVIYYYATRSPEQPIVTTTPQQDTQVFVGFDSLLGRGVTNTRLEQIESQFTVFTRDRYTTETIVTLDTDTIRRQTLPDDVINYSFVVTISNDVYTTEASLINPALTALKIVDQNDKTVYSTAYDNAPRTRP